MKKVILLDRDGVINKDSLEYVKSVDEFFLIPGSAQAIARLTKAGYTIGVATNQSGVSRGLYSEVDLLAMHRKMMDTVNEAGGRIDAIEYCIHLPEQQCLCRKPAPGMLFALAKKLDCSLTNVFFVGDRITDIQAALAAGATPAVVRSSMTDSNGLNLYPNVPVFNSLAVFVDHFLSLKNL